MESCTVIISDQLCGSQVWRRLCEDHHGVEIIDGEYESLTDLHAGEVPSP